MKALLKSALTLSMVLSFGCSASPENADEPAVTEEAIQEPPADVEPTVMKEIPTSLVGVEWSVKDIGGAAVVEDSQATLVFAEDGQITGNASCNSFFGTYETTEAALKITTAGMTRMACSQAAMDQETALMTTLAQIDGYQIDEAGVLTLHAADHTVITAHP